MSKLSDYLTQLEKDEHKLSFSNRTYDGLVSNNGVVERFYNIKYFEVVDDKKYPGEIWKYTPAKLFGNFVFADHNIGGSGVVFEIEPPLNTPLKAKKYFAIINLIGQIIAK